MELGALQVAALRPGHSARCADRILLSISHLTPRGQE
jgi:hypothetical protein